MTTDPTSRCAWCRGPLPPNARRDSICCSTRCRQARHRFTTAVGRADRVAAGHPRRLAYADPPYPGLSARYYAGHRDFAGEVDHAELVSRLQEFDAWALSTSARRLPEVLVLCPPQVRVAAWVRGERPNQRARFPQNAWEPVILGGDLSSRLPATDDASTPGGHDASPTWSGRRLDALVHFARPRTTDPERVVGSKPAAFCGWLFGLLGAQLGDELVDLFPGSGGVSRAWASWCDASSSTVVQRDASRLAAARRDGTVPA